MERPAFWKRPIGAYVGAMILGYGCPGAQITVMGATATFDNLAEGLYGNVLQDGGITFFAPEARSARSPDVFAVDDVSTAFAILTDFADFTPPNVLGVGTFGPGPIVGGSAPFGLLRATTGSLQNFASLDVFYFAVPGYTLGNSILLEAYRDGVLVASDSIHLDTCCDGHTVLQIEGVDFDTIQIGGIGDLKDGIFFGAIDNVVIVPDVPTGWLVLLAGLGLMLRQHG